MEYEEAVRLGSTKKAGKIIEGTLARREFDTIDYWTVTEKVDGTNVRIFFDRIKTDGSGKSIEFGGRTGNAQLPTTLFSYLLQAFTEEKMSSVFKEAKQVMLFGEGYGGNIQSGSHYSDAVSFILFDAYIDGWWLDVSSVHGLARDLGIRSVPLLEYILPIEQKGLTESTFIWSKDMIVDYVRGCAKSRLSKDDVVMEGIVARSCPMMLFRDGLPIMFKLKCKDFQ